ncbi:SdpI family protein [Chloroflexales bacterium ZM16-3]|nr:SdpI family protein [Chloroflexales bacterium ZM16-3]
MWSQPFVIPAGIFFVLTLPLILGLIPPNRGYGIRTAATLADPQVWYRVNRVGGTSLCLASLTYLVVAALAPTPLAARSDLRIWLLHLAAFALPMLGSLLLVRREIALR